MSHRPRAADRRALGLALFGSLTMALAAEVPPLYQPPGMWIWDNWFAREGDTWHAYYLQCPACGGPPGDWSWRPLLNSVGHATSTDLVHWTDRGPVVTPLLGSWLERLATGSVTRTGREWAMLFTAGGPQAGVALAVSPDLNRWTKVGDGPVLPFAPAYPGTWEGRPVTWRGNADPYIFPEPLDGWFYLVLNSRLEGAPQNQSGCLTLSRSRDLHAWEPVAVLTAPGWFERLETPQLWRHGERWYLYFGGAHDHDIPATWTAVAPAKLRDARRVNCLFIADRLEGPYRPAPRFVLELPDGRHGYICKVLPGERNDMLIVSTGERMSRAYPVTYEADGSLTLGAPAVPSP